MNPASGVFVLWGLFTTETQRSTEFHREGISPPSPPHPSRAARPGTPESSYRPALRFANLTSDI